MWGLTTPTRNYTDTVCRSTPAAETGTDPSNRRRSGPHRGCPLRWEAYMWRKVDSRSLAVPMMPAPRSLQKRRSSSGPTRPWVVFACCVASLVSARVPPAGGRFDPERTSVLVRPCQPRGERPDLLGAQPLTEDERERRDRGDRLAPQAGQLTLLGPDAARSSGDGPADGVIRRHRPPRRPPHQGPTGVAARGR